MNEYTEKQRVNRYAGAKMKRDAQDLVCHAIKGQLRNLQIKKKVNIEYLWIEPNHRRDKDNISGFGHKVIQDALVECKVLKDDGWDEIEGMTDRYEVDRNYPRILVVLDEVEDG